ncbi:MAG: SRPBCC domain-containing protein [Chloroflexota bacterium]
MKTFQADVTINAEPETVWAILTDAAGYPDWDPTVIRIEGTIAAGNKITAISKLAPDRKFPVTVSMFDAPHKMEWSSGMPFGLFKGVRSFTLTPQDGGTHFEVREAFSGPMLALIGGTIPDMTEPFAQFSEGLKAHAEAGGKA